MTTVTVYCYTYILGVLSLKEKKLTTRQIKAIETKEKIYKSAEHLFLNMGFDDVSVDDIVKHAQVAKGTFYVHYESKDALVALLIKDYVKKVDLDYKAYLEDLPDDMSINEILLSLVGKIADVMTDVLGHEIMKNLYKVYISQVINTDTLTNYNRELYTLFKDLIARGMEQHLFKPGLTTNEIAQHFVLAYRGLTFEWCIRYPDFNLKEQAISHFNILLKGIIAP